MKRLLFLIIAIVITNMAISQNASPELISSSGDSFTNTSYQLDWSVGECVTEMLNAGNYVINQGFHQNTYLITAVEDRQWDINISVYPNPTSDFLCVDFAEFMNFGKVSENIITITDNYGKVILQKQITSNKEQIDFSPYAYGTYIITIETAEAVQTVHSKKKLIKSFKLIKK